MGGHIHNWSQWLDANERRRSNVERIDELANKRDRSKDQGWIQGGGATGVTSHSPRERKKINQVEKRYIVSYSLSCTVIMSIMYSSNHMPTS